jgi:hypothetical protein
MDTMSEFACVEGFQDYLGGEKASLIFGIQGSKVAFVNQKRVRKNDAMVKLTDFEVTLVTLACQGPPS